VIILLLEKIVSLLAINIIIISSWVDRNRSDKTGQEKNEKRLPDLAGIPIFLHNYLIVFAVISETRVDVG
jgi:hypothetical protein